MEQAFGARLPTTPGRKLRYMVGPFRYSKDYENDAKDFVQKVINKVKITSKSKILEVGCGSGRLIFELYKHNPKCSYYGFDIISDLIDWSNKASSKLKGNFTFNHANIYNSLYNPGGVVKASDLIFPYEDNFFDLIIVQSVFTHMLAKDVNNYLNEVFRVLKPGGKVVTTWFLINNTSKIQIKSQKSDFKFSHKYKSEYINDKIYPEAAVAYNEKKVLPLMCGKNFKLLKGMPVYGKWSGLEGLVYQDLIILSKQL